MDAEEHDFPRSIGKVAPRALAEHGITRMDQLPSHTEKELLSLHGFGPKALRLLREELAARGLSFRPAEAAGVDDARRRVADKGGDPPREPPEETTMADKRGSEANGFSDEEKAAMKARTAELRAEKAAKRSADKAAALEQLVLETIAAMPEPDRALAKRLHELVHEVAPRLGSKTWYGMPAYTDSEGKVVLFFQAASKFGVRYATLGFNEEANLDEGTMWPTYFAITELNPDNEKRIADLIRRAVS